MSPPTTGRLDLSIWRNDEIYEYPLRVVGLDLTNVGLAMEVRLGPDTPGAPLISLAKVDNGNSEGLRVAAVETIDGLPVSDLRIRINKTTRRDLPYAGEVGDSSPLTYALLFDGVTRLVGAVTVLAHSFGSNAAPTNRPPIGGGSSAGQPSSGATLTIARSAVTEVILDGGGSQAAARRAEAAAVEAETTNARATLAQRSPFQPAANFAVGLTRDQLRGFILDVDLSDWPGYNPARFYSFASIAKSANEVTLLLYEQAVPGEYVEPPVLTFTAKPADGYVAASKDVMVLTSTAGVGSVAIVPAAVPNSNAARGGMGYTQAGLDDHVFRAGYGLFARLAGRRVVTADPATGVYDPSVAYIHPADATERLGDSVFENRGLGQSQVIDRDMVVQKIGTAFFSAGGAPFRGRIKIVRKASLFDPSPDAGVLIEEIVYPEAVYAAPIDVMLSSPVRLARGGGFLAAYAIPDAGYTIAMRQWDHPRLGQPNPTGRTPLFFLNGANWSTGAQTADFARFQVPLRLLTNIATIDDVGKGGGGGGDALALRVDTSLDMAGFLRDQHVFGASTVREFPRKWAMLRAGLATTLTLAHCPADSQTADEPVVAMEAQALRKPVAAGGGGNGGPGWCGIGFAPSKDGASNAVKSDPENVQGNVDNAELRPIFVSGNWHGRYLDNEHSPDLCSAFTDDVGAQVDFVYTGADTTTLVHLDYTCEAGTGVAEYRWNDAGAWTALNLVGQGGAKVALANVPAGAWRLNIRTKAGGRVHLNGVVPLTGAGVVVHSLAVNGSSLAGWTFLLLGQNDPQAAATKRAAHAAALTRLGKIDTFLCPISTNDQNGYTGQQYRVGMGFFVGEQARVAGRLGCDIVWQILPETRTAVGFTPMATFEAVAKKVAAEKGFALICYQRFFGDAPAQYNNTGTHRQLIGPDGLHLNTEGEFVISAVRVRFLLNGAVTI